VVKGFLKQGDALGLHNSPTDSTQHEACSFMNIEFLHEPRTGNSRMRLQSRCTGGCYSFRLTLADKSSLACYWRGWGRHSLSRERFYESRSCVQKKLCHSLTNPI
jgi:hypothetical protein